MSAFEKSICISNIYFLVKEKGLKIGDIEEAAGVSPGYISRLNKEENKTVPGIEFLLAVSESLGVSLEGLIKCDYKSLTPDERKSIDFLTKLLKDSYSFDLLWDEQSRSALYNIVDDGNGYYADHPLMETCETDDYPPVDVRFYSRFFADSSCLIQECFETNLNQIIKLFLLSINYVTFEGNKTSGFELYMQLKGRIIPICAALQNKEMTFYTLLQSLISAAKNSSSHVHLDEDAKDVIDAYINGMDEFFDALSDGDIPF